MPTVGETPSSTAPRPTRWRSTSTIQRLVDPVSGTIALKGRDITHLSQRELRPVRRTMQMIYQDPYESLDPRLRVRQAIEEPMLIHRLDGKRAARERRIIDALARVDLSPAEMFLDRFPHELSGGQRERVAIAAALVLEPTLLVADEPVSMLDVSVRAGVLHLLDGLRRSANLGIVMITHDPVDGSTVRGPHRGDVLGPDRGRGSGTGRRPQPPPSIHEGAAVGRPQA